MIPLCSRFDSVLFTPKMSAIACHGNYSRSPQGNRRDLLVDDVAALDLAAGAAIEQMGARKPGAQSVETRAAGQRIAHAEIQNEIGGFAAVGVYAPPRRRAPRNLFGVHAKPLNVREIASLSL
jgi:hypothetical protein